MKTVAVVVFLALGVYATADDTGRHLTVHWPSRIDAREYVAELTDDTFSNVPPFKLESGAEPPLAIPQVYRIAEKQFLQCREPQLTYVLQSITLNRFHGTEHWYYMVSYGVQGPSWKDVEPYKSKIEADETAVARPPHITIVVLLDGRVVRQTLWK